MSFSDWRRRRRRVPFIPQMEMAECGAASLAMVLAYYGHHAPLPEVRQACGVSRDGTSGLAILEAAWSYGLAAQGVTLEMEGLKDLPLPAVLHWGFQHFVVLERLRRNGAVLVDPASGRRSVTMDEIAQRFTGVAIAFAPGETFEMRPAMRPGLTRYRRLLWEALPSLGQILGASIILQFLALAIPVSTQVVVDRVIAMRNSGWLGILISVMAAVIATSTLLRLLRSWITQRLQTSIGLSLMGEFVDHMLHLPLSFFEQRTPGDLLQRVENNGLLRDFFTTRAVATVLDSTFVIGYAALMLYYSPKLGAVTLLLSVIRAAFLIGGRKRYRQIIAAELAASGRESGALVEALSTLETVKSSGAELHMVRRVLNRMTNRVNSSLQRQQIEIESRLFTMILQGGGMAAILWLGGHEVVDGRMTIGAFAAFLALQSQFLAPLESLVGAVNQLQYLNGHLYRLDDVMEARREPSGSVTPGRLTGAIELDDVTFSYGPRSEPVLRNITMRIAPGERIALVGATGAGKSTLARLILGLHTPQSGAIRFDDCDLRDIEMAQLRAQIGVVLQDDSLFSDTVRANLSLNDPDLPLDRLKEAAAIACVDEVIDRLPERYDTLMGANGRQFSGGERQRLALARALAHDPAMLLLDEATSALDLETEGQLHANLAARNVTRIVIAHRMATVRDADRVFVIENGRIAQEGRFDELSEVDGPFRNLLRKMERHA